MWCYLSDYRILGSCKFLICMKNNTQVYDNNQYYQSILVLYARWWSLLTRHIYAYILLGKSLASLLHLRLLIHRPQILMNLTVHSFFSCIPSLSEYYQTNLIDQCNRDQTTSRPRAGWISWQTTSTVWCRPLKEPWQRLLETCKRIFY